MRAKSWPLVSAIIMAGVLSWAGCASDGPKPKKAKKSVPNPVAARFQGVEAIAAVDAYIADHPVDRSNPQWKTRLPYPPFVEFDPMKDYYWLLDTSAGLIKIRLMPEYAPHHVSTTIYLTRLGFYEGLTFHRIIPEFMAQGGCPLGTGTGSPGFRYAGEFHKKAKHDEKGILSAANAGPRTDGSQFFITFKEAPSLDGRHTVYGEVVEGRGTLRTLEAYGSKSGKPEKIVTIRRAEVWVE